MLTAYFSSHVSDEGGEGSLDSLPRQDLQQQVSDEKMDMGLSFPTDILEVEVEAFRLVASGAILLFDDISENKYSNSDGDD